MSQGSSQPGSARRGGNDQLFRTLADNAPVFIWMVDADGRCIYLNRAWLTFTGRSAEQEDDGGWLTGIHPEDEALCASEFARCFASRAPFSLEYRLRRRDGEFRWVVDHAVPHFDDEGTFGGYVGSCIDIHDRRVAEQERARAAARVARDRQRLDDLLAAVPGVVWEAWGEPDVTTQRINFVSEHVERMLGYSVEEWLASPNFWLTIVHPDDRERAAAEGAAFFASGVGGTSQFRWVSRDGRVVEVEAQSVIALDDDGRPVGMRGVTMDITERKRAVDSIRLLSRVSEVLGSSLDFGTTITAALRVALAQLGDLCLVDLVEGDSFRRVAAVHRHAAKDREFADFREFPPLLASDSPAAVALRTGSPVCLHEIDADTITRYSISPAHTRLMTALAARSSLTVPLSVRGRVIGAMSFASTEIRHYDTTRIELAGLVARRIAVAIDNSRLYREAVEANAAKDEFLATLSHELRTPMTAILGWVRMLQIGELEPELTTTALETVERSAKAQARIIDDILDVSRIITGKFQLDIGDVDLPSVIMEAIATLRPAATAKDITIEFDQSAFDGRAIAADAGRIRQVIWNLLSNAVKFNAKRGRVHVRLSCSPASVRLEVEDSGEGIDEAFLPFVFDRFKQADGSSTRQSGGLGLGLAIVRHLVELHGGAVRAESAGRGQGSRFTVELPVGHPRAEKSPQRPANALPRLDGARILVVDDEPDCRGLLASVLRHCGAIVTEAESADAAMSADEGGAHDLLVTDLAMPDVDGFSLLARLSLRRSTTPIPAIAVTANGQESDRTDAMDRGFSAYLRKPIEPADLAREAALLLVSRSRVRP